MTRFLTILQMHRIRLAFRILQVQDRRLRLRIFCQCLRQPPPRQSLRNPNRVPDTLRRGEDMVNFLQRSSRRLGQEEIYNRHPRRVQNTIHNEIPIPDIRERDRRDLRNEEVEQPAHGRANPTDLPTQLHGRDFASVEEGDAQKPNRVRDIVQKQKEHGSLQGTPIIRIRYQPRLKRKTHTIRGSAKQHQTPPAKAIYRKTANTAPNDDSELTRRREDLGCRGREPQVRLIDARGVVGNTVHARELQHNLHARGNDDAMEDLLRAHREHGSQGSRLREISRQLQRELDVGDLLLDRLRILMQRFKDPARLGHFPLLHQQPRAFGQREDKRHHNHGHQHRHRKRKPPAKAPTRIAASEIKPQRQHEPYATEDAERGDVRAAAACFGQLGLPD